MDKRKAIGFYWTLPVTWRDVNKPDVRDVDEATKNSRTIAWQKEAVHRWAKENGYEVVEERAYLELQPDRVLPYVEGELRGLAERAKHLGASILFVDFSLEIGWRRHILLNELAGSAEPFVAVSLYRQEADRFAKHFASWRADHKDWVNSKAARVQRASVRATELQASGLKNAEIAECLNLEDIPTSTGKMWKADSLRKFLQKHSNSE